MRILSFLILLIPAAYTWWYGRRLLRQTSDPQFAELHVSKAQHLGSVLGLCLGVSLVLNFEHTGIKLLLAFLATTAADYRYHRTIFSESWGFFAYLSFVARMSMAQIGAWILIALMPELVRMAGDAWMPVAVGLALVILIASQLYSGLFRWLLGAREIGHPELEARFAQILLKAGCKVPWIGRAGPAGGFWINAMAVPSFHQQGVLLSNDLLASLGPRETTAIFAHEVGHIEQFNRKRLLASELVLWTFVALPLILAFSLGPGSKAFGIAAAAWPLLVLVWFSLSATRKQQHEHEGDLRALELCGDPQALIDGLTKVHLLGRLPRRWEAHHESQMSHPSLAQRLRAIRDAAGISEPEVAELVVRAADGNDRAVILAPDRLFWLAGIPPAPPTASPPVGSPPVGSPPAATDPTSLIHAATDQRTILYTDLTDLRLAAGGLKTRQLIATDRQGTSMKLPIRLRDVPAVKSALARIDARLRGTAPGLSAAAAVATTSSIWVRVDAVLLMMIGLLSPSSGTLSLASLLVLIRPAQANLAAAGTIAVTSALLGLATFEAPLWGDNPKLWLLAGFAWFGLYFLWLAIRRYRARVEEPAWTLWTGLGALGGFAMISALLGLSRLPRPMPAMQMHLWAQKIPAVILLSIGLAAMLLTVRRWPARGTAAVLLLGVAAVSVVATPWFRDHYGHDPFAAGTPPLANAPLAMTKARELTVDGYVIQLLLSPSGKRLAYSGDYADPEYADGSRPSFHVEQGDGGFTKIEAMALDFLDDDRLAALVLGDDTMTLRIVELSAEPAPVTEIALPLLIAPKLRVDPSLDRWQIIGTTEGGGELLHLEGALTGSLETTDGHQLEENEAYWISGQTAIDARGHLLTAHQDFGFGTSSGSFWIGMAFNFLSGAATTCEIAVLESPNDGQTKARVLALTTYSAQCFDPGDGQTGFLCAATDNQLSIPWSFDDDTQTDLWSIEPSSGLLSPIGSLPDSYYEAQIASNGLALFNAYGSTPTIVDPSARTAANIGPQLALEPALQARLQEVTEDLAEELAESDFGAEDLTGQSPAELLFDNLSPTFAFRPGLLGVAVAGEEDSTILVYRLP